MSYQDFFQLRMCPVVFQFGLNEQQEFNSRR